MAQVVFEVIPGDGGVVIRTKEGAVFIPDAWRATLAQYVLTVGLKEVSGG